MDFYPYQTVVDKDDNTLWCYDAQRVLGQYSGKDPVMADKKSNVVPYQKGKYLPIQDAFGQLLFGNAYHQNPKDGECHTPDMSLARFVKMTSEDRVRIQREVLDELMEDFEVRLQDAIRFKQGFEDTRWRGNINMSNAKMKGTIALSMFMARLKNRADRVFEGLMNRVFFNDGIWFFDGLPFVVRDTCIFNLLKGADIPQLIDFIDYYQETQRPA